MGYKIGDAPYSAPGNSMVPCASCPWIKNGGYAPETMVMSGAPTPQMQGEDAFFRFACSEKSCVFFTSLNNEEYEAVDGNTKAFYDLPEGLHTLKVYAVDAAGNMDPTPAAYTWSVYGEMMHTAYTKVAGFAGVESTPLDFVPEDADFVHNATGYPERPAPVDDEK